MFRNRRYAQDSEDIDISDVIYAPNKQSFDDKINDPCKLVGIEYVEYDSISPILYQRKGIIKYKIMEINVFYNDVIQYSDDSIVKVSLGNHFPDPVKHVNNLRSNEFNIFLNHTQGNVLSRIYDEDDFNISSIDDKGDFSHPLLAPTIEVVSGGNSINRFRILLKVYYIIQ